MRDIHPQGHSELIAAAFAASIPFPASRQPVYDKIAELEPGTNIPPLDYIPPEQSSDYFDWWASAGESEVYDRLQLVNNYTERNYGEIVCNLKEELESIETPAEHPDFLYYTPIAQHYLHKSQITGSLMIRLVNHPSHFSHECNPGAQVSAIEEHIDGLRRGFGHIMLEQVEGFSYHDAATVSQSPKGEPLLRTSAAAVTQEHVEDLLNNIEYMQERGMEPDLDATSIWHDPDSGFQFFSYSSHQMRMSQPLSLREAADELTTRAFAACPTADMSNICGFISHVANSRR